MRGFNKFLTILFSIFIVAICIVLILYVGNIITTSNLISILDMLTVTKEIKLVSIIVLSLIGVCAILFAISNDSSDLANGGSLTLPLTTGNVSISGQTFETMVLNVAKKYRNLKNVKAKVNIQEDGLYVELLVYVLEGTIVSELMCKIQEDIKCSVLKQTTVEVKSVEIKVKGIYSVNENKIQD